MILLPPQILNVQLLSPQLWSVWLCLFLQLSISIVGLLPVFLFADSEHLLVTGFCVCVNGLC